MFANHNHNATTNKIKTWAVIRYLQFLTVREARNERHFTVHFLNATAALGTFRLAATFPSCGLQKFG